MKALIIISFCLVLVQGANILCTEDYCQTYLNDNTCPEIPFGCTIQNDTHSGEFLPFAGPCHCCEFCLENLAEDDHCPIGDAASTMPRAICGDLLMCKPEETGNLCRPIEDTTCTRHQKEYDAKRNAGTLGYLELRPNCERRGLYGPFICIPGEICYCVNEEGERIFGEMPFSILAPAIMNCACSAQYEKAKNFLGTPIRNSQFLRCRSTGDYDPLQCINGTCFCVHTEDGTEALNRHQSVNITSISNHTLTCFNNNTHIEGEYYKECEARVVEILDELAEFEALGFEVIGYDFPNCQLDGYYASVQQNATHKYCSDPHGNALENFIVTIDDDLSADMDCYCARSRSITTGDMPQCCRNGNYNPVQCRRGLCRCVDSNGNQIEKEVDFAVRDTLSCFLTGCAYVEEDFTTTETVIEERF